MPRASLSFTPIPEYISVSDDQSMGNFPAFGSDARVYCSSICDTVSSDLSCAVRGGPDLSF